MTPVAVEGATVRCSHGLGTIAPRSSRRFLRVGGAAVLTRPDLPANPVRLCPNIGPTVKPCTLTLAPASGWSGFVFAAGAPVVLGGASGGTDGVPPGVTTYAVRDSGQGFVRVGG